MFYFNTENTEDTEMIYNRRRVYHVISPFYVYQKLCVLCVLCVKKESYELEKLE